MQIYLVGGAVRDALMGHRGEQPCGDKDWVVVGSSPQAMLAQGFLPVGKDFPVFLHPQTKEEYALARQERKTAKGYAGFAFHASPEVTLEEDLLRRDLTINAMAQDAHGRIIDPYGGQQDLQHKVLRHVSSAFAEDPVRLLRVARFAARWPDFSIAPETLGLLKDLVRSGEVQALVVERVWQELSRALQATAPVRFFEVLASCGAWEVLMPPQLKWTPALQRDLALLASKLGDLDDLDDLGGLGGLGDGAGKDDLIAMRWACLVWAAAQAWPEAAAPMAQMWRVPNHCAAMAKQVLNLWKVLDQKTASAEVLMQAFESCDAWRQVPRFEHSMQVLQALVQHSSQGEAQLAHLQLAWQKSLAVDAKAVVKQAQQQGLMGVALAQALAQARRRSLEPVL